jgi:hypothetical protein
VPSADGWELVLAENIACLVDDQRRWQALEELRGVVGLAPEQILGGAPVPGGVPRSAESRLRHQAPAAAGRCHVLGARRGHEPAALPQAP